MGNDFLKTLILVVVIMYVLSPIDGCPGPIDDVIIAVLGVAARNRLSESY